MLDFWMPVAFVGLMALAIIIYAILDGYDLGVGVLLPMDASNEPHRDKMIASIGPFWDANETWLVLAIGLLLIAFPKAYSLVFYHLYIPTAIMLIGLIIRGVSFDFRAKVGINHKLAWDRAFKAGSLLTALSQGYMLGLYVMAFDSGWPTHFFALLSALGVTAAYCYIGSAWLIWKTEGQLQRDAVKWAIWSGRAGLLGVIAVSVINPLVNPSVFSRWFDFPLVMFVLLIPALCFLTFLANDIVLRQLPKENDHYCWLPFILVVCIFLCCFVGIAFSFFPDVVPGKMQIWQAASATGSLLFIFVGAVIVIPLILGYTVFSYWVFRGKTTDLQYH